jgi:molybdate transport system substrate-binding protein
MKKSFAAATLAIVAGVSLSANVATLATMAVQGALDQLIQQFQQQTGHRVTVAYDTGPNLARRVAGNERADVLIAPAAVVDQASKDARVVTGTRADIGRVGVGLATRKGARTPDIGSSAALKQALVQADAVLYSRGTSGVYVEKLLNDLGVADQIRSKTTVLANGGAVLEQLVADRRNTLGFTMVSEIKLMEPKGVALVGPLPAERQNYTTYAAAVMTSASDAAAARSFIAFITSPAARTLLVSTGWQP